MNQNRIVNRAIVAACFAIVFLPLIVSRLRTEIANWHLAAAANAIEIGQGDAENSIRKARETGVELESLHNFWLLRTEQALIEKPDLTSSVIEESKAAGANFRILGMYAADRLQRKNDHSNAVSVWEATLTEEQRTQPAALNQLAYLRSLSGLQLDKALEDIDRAIESLEEGPFRNQRESAYRDTKAWVLFQMGRLPEAAEEAEIAVEKLTADSQDGRLDLSSRVLLWLNRQLQPELSQDLEEGEVLAERDAGMELWNEGVIRYHRARILEELGRTEKAQADYDWLVEHHLPTDDRLN